MISHLSLSEQDLANADVDNFPHCISCGDIAALLTHAVSGQLSAIAEKNGLKGAVEATSPYLWKLWGGAGK